MRKYFFVFIAAFACVTPCFAQSAALKQSFNELNSFLKEYTINTYSDREHVVTKNMTASYNHPYLTITYTDVHEDGWSGGSVIVGNKVLKMDLKGSCFEASELGYSTYLYLRNPDGIEKTEKDRKELVEVVRFQGTPLTLKKAASLLNDFKNKVIAEGFTGKIPASASSGSSSNSSGSTTSNWPSYNGGSYSIKYPNNWEASSRGNQLILMQKRTNDDDFMPNINIIVSTTKRTESTRDLATIAYNQVKNTGITTGSVSIESATLAGLSGHSWTTAVTMEGFRLLEKQYIVKKSDNTTYIVSIMIEQSKKSSQLNTANTILGTLSIK